MRACASYPRVAPVRSLAEVRAQPGKIAAFFLSSGGAPVEWFEALIAEGVATGEFHPKIESQRFLTLMCAITVAHFAAIPWLSRRVPVDPCDREELEKHKHEILLVARTMLGYDPSERDGRRYTANAVQED